MILFGKNKKHSSESFFYMCMCKMAVEITKETWEKCGIKIFICHNKEKKSVVAENEPHWNTTWAFKYCWICVKKNQKILRQKNKRITEEEKQKYKAYFKGKEGVFIIEKLPRDIIECCKLPEAIKLRKQIGYNHEDIMVWEETSIAEKIIKLFPNDNVVLNKKFNNRKPDIWFKYHSLIIEVDEGNHENFVSDDEKERKDMFKKHNLKIFWCSPNDPNFDLFKFL